ncbi:MAG: 6-carboxytetrahydropterin synthase [Phycisphaerae bacterium]|nr:6-carboxytetrahydropterin synthase [Phycisphaerae bacterium]
MHKLARQIRFAVDPFAAAGQVGANSYYAKPGADTLALYFALWVELIGRIDADTGFVVNVTDIDRIVRAKAVNIFEEFVKDKFVLKEQITFEQIGQLLSTIWIAIENEFTPAKINNLTVELAPARKLGIKERDGNMLYFSEKFDFAASHTLWNKKFSNEQNYDTFGKCANPTGHGHNYIIEVTIKQSRDSNGAVKAGEFETAVQKHFISIVDHKNLNADIEHFATVNPTVENIAEFAFNCLAGKFDSAKLDSVTVWESDRAFCSFRRD